MGSGPRCCAISSAASTAAPTSAMPAASMRWRRVCQAFHSSQPTAAATSSSSSAYQSVASVCSRLAPPISSVAGTTAHCAYSAAVTLRERVPE
ncbi:hypothetical protein [Aquincola sp. J276]|uniref:hypothetical protein n=1 Tax=Aquincola sp. J276 TaxID=2898432 RepID=UPI0028735D30|nr:hypothetical protein [Aquincola sp. J276]